MILNVFNFLEEFMETYLPQPCSSNNSSDLPDINMTYPLPVQPPQPNPQMSQYQRGASVGALDKFQEPYVAQAYAPSAKTTYTENWLSSYHGVANNSVTYSNTPSIASQATAVSRLSAASIQTELSIFTDMESLTTAPKFPAMCMHSSNASTSSYMENVDPHYYQRMEDYLQKIASNLDNSTTDEHFSRVLCELKRVAKHIYCRNYELLQMILHSLFSALDANNVPLKRIRSLISILHDMVQSRDCLEAFGGLILSSNGTVIMLLFGFLNPNETYGMYVMNILHTLFERFGESCRQYAKCEFPITQLKNFVMPSVSYKSRHIALFNLRALLRDGGTSLQEYFVNEGGLEICLALIRDGGDERLLYSSVSLISLLLNNVSIGQHFVKIGGLQDISKHLDHGSPRFIVEIAKCLSMVSDYPLFEQQNFDDVLWRVIQILGSSNSDLIYHSTGFLANVQHNNSNVKKFLHDNKAVEDCMELLRTFAIHRNHPKFPGIVDNILLTLSNLISFPEDMKKYVYSACQRMMLVKDATSIFLNVLRISLGMKNSVQLAGRIFHLFNRILDHLTDRQTVMTLITARDPRQGGDATFYALNIMSKLAEIIFNRSRQPIPPQSSRDVKESDLNFLKEKTLFKRTLRFIGRISYYVSLPDIMRNNRIHIIDTILPRLLVTDDLATEFVNFLFQTSNNHALMQFWAFDKTTMETLHRICNTESVNPTLKEQVHLFVENLKLLKNYTENGQSQT